VSDRRQPVVEGVVARFQRTVLQNAFDGYVERKKVAMSGRRQGADGSMRKWNQTRK
jgi:hypothetical protein